MAESHGSEVDTPVPSAPLFTSHELLQVVLTAPLTTIYRERTQDKRDYHPGTLSYTDVSGNKLSLATQVRTRGNFRRDRTNCRYPPLQLNFPRKELKDKLKNSLFQGQNKLKLVSNCKSAKRYDSMLLNEYMAYRVFNLMSESSFKVRLLRITFRDSEGKQKEATRYGFFIEPKRALAKRRNATLPDIDAVAPDELDAVQSSLVEVFQYLIGNTDWSMLRGPEGEHCCHNLVLLRDQRGSLFPVPYDFDFAGIVNAPYATPNEQLGIKSVRKRLFRGRCRSAEALRSTLDAYLVAKPAILELYQSEPRFDDRSRQSSMKYLEDFYRTVAQPKRMNRELVKSCRG